MRTDSKATCLGTKDATARISVAKAGEYANGKEPEPPFFPQTHPKRQPDRAKIPVKPDVSEERRLKSGFLEVPIGSTMKLFYLFISTFAFVLFSCKPRPNSSQSTNKSNVSSRTSDLVAEAFFDNLYYTEPINDEEIKFRKANLVRICLYAWLLDSEKHVKISRELLKRHSNKLEVREFMADLKNHVSRVVINEKMHSTYAQDADRKILLIVPTASKKMERLFGADYENSVDAFILFVFK